MYFFHETFTVCTSKRFPLWVGLQVEKVIVVIFVKKKQQMDTRTNLVFTAAGSQGRSAGDSGQRVAWKSELVSQNMPFRVRMYIKYEYACVCDVHQKKENGREKEKEHEKKEC